MDVDKMEEKDWKYHGEGNKSLVLSHVQLSRVLRLLKYPAEDSENPPQTVEQAFRQIQNIVDFSSNVMSSLLGEKFIHSGEVVKLPLEFVRQLSIRVQHQRPGGEREVEKTQSVLSSGPVLREQTENALCHQTPDRGTSEQLQNLQDRTSCTETTESTRPAKLSSTTSSSVRTRLQIDGPYDEAFLEKLQKCPTEDDGSVEFAVAKVHQYRVAMTAKDCSIMVALVPSSEKEEDDEGQRQLRDFLSSRPPAFSYSVSILDLDPKPFDSIPRQLRLDQKIVSCYLRTGGALPKGSLPSLPGIFTAAEREDCTLLFHPV
ncbi:Inositol-pentakisphosphate 2-kinase [Larimichthys crocea]|uniref:Uncharacterized protein n=1 Tax=Larimichthys crocea TaxID=215358 RepID=A0ACD3RIU0_LARCR|nr:Inositol-pentakisphosphate 2-kinase [Larimichthys crocea]